MSQPAAELIANALAKIKKLAGSKKHADLAQKCQKLIDSIHEVSLGGQQLQRYGWHTLSAAGASSSHSLHTCGVVSVLMNHHGNPQTPVMYHTATLKVTCAAGTTHRCCLRSMPAEQQPRQQQQLQAQQWSSNSLIHQPHLLPGSLR